MMRIRTRIFPRRCFIKKRERNILSMARNQYINTMFRLTRLKGMTFDHDFCLFILLFFFPLFLRGKRKGKKNNQRRGQKSCLSVWSFRFAIIYQSSLILLFTITPTCLHSNLTPILSTQIQPIPGSTLISFQHGSIQISLQPGSTLIQLQPGSTLIQLQPGSTLILFQQGSTQFQLQPVSTQIDSNLAPL